jgi:D-aspartate ligase
VHGCTGRKLRQLPPNAGIMAAGEAVWLPDVAVTSESFLKAIDYRGLGGIEYKRHEGTPYFIEMSVRPEGFLSLAVDAGVDLPWYAYLDTALDRMPREPVRQAVQTRYVAIDGYVGILRSGGPRLPYLLELGRVVLGGKVRFAIWRLNDLGPWLRSLAGLCRSAVRKITGRVLRTKGY